MGTCLRGTSESILFAYLTPQMKSAVASGGTTFWPMTMSTSSTGIIDVVLVDTRRDSTRCLAQPESGKLLLIKTFPPLPPRPLFNCSQNVHFEATGLAESSCRSCSVESKSSRRHACVSYFSVPHHNHIISHHITSQTRPYPKPLSDFST